MIGKQRRVVIRGHLPDRFCHINVSGRQVGDKTKLLAAFQGRPFRQGLDVGEDALHVLL
jgi:hypothetical protein